MTMEKYKWNALFKDGTKISQFDKQGMENSFKKVQEKLDDVLIFELSNEDNYFSVDLRTGTFNINDHTVDIFEPVDYKLIFFKRRHTINYSTHIITEYWFGWQAGREKLMLRITDDGFYFRTVS